MAERIDVPPTLQGDEREQLKQVWNYLYRLSNAINNNLEGIGGNELTDSERKMVAEIVGRGSDPTGSMSEAETLKSLIIKTADFVQTKLTEYRMNLLGETVESGKFGKYVRSTGLDVAVTPEGVMQKYSFREIIQGLKEYTINAKNYIKTGLLRTVGSIPVYGVAIGKDVVTFSEDGTETYNDGNKVAELTADELSFWQNSVKIAGYTGNRISFYYNGSEVFYIQQGKLYAVGDLEIGSGNKIIIGDWAFKRGGLIYKKSDETIGFQIGKLADKELGTSGIFYRYYTSDDDEHLTYGQMLFYPALAEDNVVKVGKFEIAVIKRTDNTYYKVFAPYNAQGETGVPAWLGSYSRHFVGAYIDAMHGNADTASKADKADYVDCKYDSTITNFNNMTSDGRWWVSLSSMNNGPSDFTVGIGIVDIISVSSTNKIQIIYREGAIYTRNLVNGSFSSWYKYSGTAV